MINKAYNHDHKHFFLHLKIIISRYYTKEQTYLDSDSRILNLGIAVTVQLSKRKPTHKKKTFKLLKNLVRHFLNVSELC